MSNIFSSVEVLKVPRSRFKFRKTRRATYGYGKIYPCYIRNCTPSETVRISMMNMVKAQPMSAPSMTPQRFDYHFFFVPYRILDEYFTKGYVGVSDVDFTYNGVDYKKGEEFPYQFPIWSPSADDLKIGSLWDYFGFGINVKDILSVDPHDIPESGDINSPFYLGTNAKGVEPSDYVKRAYNLIYNTMFRDESLCDEVDLESSAIQYRSYRPDYFTKALPYQQIPSDVTFALPFQIGISWSGTQGIPLTIEGRNSSNEIVHSYVSKTGTVFLHGTNAGNNGDKYYYHVDGSSASDPVTGIQVGLPTNNSSINTRVNFAGVGSTSDHPFDTADGSVALRGNGPKMVEHLDAQVSQALTVAETRQAFQMLKEAERTQRSGYRFDEYCKSHWATFPGDARLQLPEFIGGMKVPLIVGDSIQTSATTSASSQGNRVGIGNAVGGSSTHWYHCTEPGIIIGLVSILPRSEYMQGIPKMWQLHDRYDFPRHEFCCLSEQPVKTGELVLSASDTDSVAKVHNETMFGYQGIYNEYRTALDETVGQMRTLYQFWHQTRIFDPSDNADDGKPSTRLNSDFIEAKNVSLRTFLNTDKRYDPFNVEEVFTTDTIMPITKRAVPGLIDHF